ncbi:MAG TPA: MarR family winged helix-turn-helix transcriptional regulator [Rudaea sp.]|nr:MarR family winged helix-turn-helix transcriptional regulator [Rudaea sp.]
MNAYINLIRAAESVMRRAHTYVEGKGFAPSEFGVLEVLRYCGRLTQGELAGKLLKTCGTVTANVDKLEKRGLVTRERSTDDRRVVTVSLTSAGKTLIDEMFPIHARCVADQFAALTRVEREQLRELCRKLGTGNASRVRNVGSGDEMKDGRDRSGERVRRVDRRAHPVRATRGRQR